MMRNLLVLLTLTLAISSIHVQKSRPSKIVVLTNARLQTTAADWVKAMGNLNGAQRDVEREGIQLGKILTELLQTQRREFINGKDAHAKWLGVQDAAKDTETERKSITAGIKKFKKSRRVPRKHLRKAWKRIGAVMKSEIKEAAFIKECRKHYKAPKAQKPESLRRLQSPVPETDKWCASQKASSLQNKFCINWGNFAEAQTKFLAANLKFHKMRLGHIDQLSKCASVMDKNIEKDMGVREVRSSTAKCVKNARKSAKREVRADKKLRKIARKTAKRAFKAFGKSYKKLRGSGKPNPQNPPKARRPKALVGMTFEKAVKFVGLNNVVGKNGKVNSVRVVKRDGKSLPVTKDLRRSRVNVEVNKSKITKVVGFY